MARSLQLEPFNIFMPLPPQMKQPDSEFAWDNFLCFIGRSGFLERIRFAIDPNTDTFYFGSR
jgi:hypothetical protein